MSDLLIPVVTHQVSAAAIPPAPRAGDLRGKHVGLIDNSKLNADLFLGRLAKILTDRFGAIVTHKIRKFAPKDHLTKNDFAKLAECDGPLWRSCGARRSDQGANALYGFTFLWWR
jgi:hypothetical protein